MFAVQSILLVMIVKAVISLTCLSNEAKEDFEKSRKAVSDVQDNINKVINQLRTMGSKITKLDNDFKALGKDLRKTKWHKYTGHCYYYGSDSTDWFMAERKCREISGYIAKIDDKEENTNLAANRPYSGKDYWIGLTDLKEGIWRWTYDQSKAVFQTWLSGYGAKGTKNNCAMINGIKTPLVDYDCHYKAFYICESNFCF